MAKYLKIGIIFLAGLLLLDLFFLNYQVISFSRPHQNLPQILSFQDIVSPTPTVAKADFCPKTCLTEINQKIASLSASLSLSPTAAPSKSTIKPISPSQTSYLPLGGGGESTNTSWTAVGGSDFTFNLADYSSSAKVTFEASLKARDAFNSCYVRIYDKTNLRTVDYSEFSTDKSEYQFFATVPLIVWSGKNSYRLELKSSNGVLCSLASPRLVIKY